MNSAIDISGLYKNYGTVQAIKGMSLVVPDNSLFGIIGPDGAGKSTLYRILATLSRPDSGKVTINGMDVVRDYAAVRRTIGYMPERFSLYPDLTVEENINFFASIYGSSVTGNHDIISPVYGQLSKFPKRKAGALSGGMKQKLALCCALIHRPEILLLDEPTTGVDAVSRGEFWDTLAELKNSGMTIVVSTSYMDEAERCDKVALMNHGVILDVDTCGGLVSRHCRTLYSAVADDMFGLLTALRDISGVEECYTFGASLHMSVTGSFNSVQVLAELNRRGITGARIEKVRGSIEDVFIHLSTK